MHPEYSVSNHSVSNIRVHVILIHKRIKKNCEPIIFLLLTFICKVLLNFLVRMICWCFINVLMITLSVSLQRTFKVFMGTNN